MSWATQYIEELKTGKTVQFRPKGNSMEGLISSGQLVTLTPIVYTSIDTEVLGSVLQTQVLETEIEKGDIVLCKVNGRQYLHLVTAKRGKQYQISNNKGYINGWITISNIFGKLIKIED